MSERQRFVLIERARIIGRLDQLRFQYFRDHQYNPDPIPVSVDDVFDAVRRIVEDKPS